MHVPQTSQSLCVGLGIILGAIQCFSGYRLFKVVLGLTGFIVGGALAAAGGYACSQTAIVAVFAGLVGGCLGAALLTALYFLGVFLSGALLGGMAGALLWAGTGGLPQPAVLLFPAVIAGVLALVFQRFMIIVATGFGGAWCMVLGVAYFTTGAFDPANIESFFPAAGRHSPVLLVCWLALGAAGALVQYSSAPKQQTAAPTPPPAG